MFGGPSHLGLILPSLSDCEVLFASVKQWVDSFGNELKQSRLRIAKRKRQQALHHVFKDCARDCPRQVDFLMHSKHAYVESGDFDARTFVLDRPSPFDMSEPVVVAGHAMAVVDQYENEIAVEEAAPCDPGDCIRQTHCHYQSQ